MKQKILALGAFARREAHHVQAVAYLVGVAAYQAVAGAGGYDAVRHWHARDWAGHLLIALGPALLFELRGKHVTVDEAAGAVRAKEDRS
ncbi:MAG TPA: hypothetical protein VF841_16755 [Anaeromyxobacter sp.]